MRLLRLYPPFPPGPLLPDIASVELSGGERSTVTQRQDGSMDKLDQAAKAAASSGPTVDESLARAQAQAMENLMGGKETAKKSGRRKRRKSAEV